VVIKQHQGRSAMSARITQKSKQPQSVSQIQIKSLVAGDIIATKSRSLSSRGIRGATFGQASHAIIYIGNANAIDAMPEEGVTRDLLSRKLAGASSAVVFRHRTATAEQCTLACQWTLQQVDKPYDYNSAARVGIHRNTRVGRLIIITDEVSSRIRQEGEDASFMCSELVFRAFAVASVPLTSAPAHCLSPGMLFRTKRLKRLGQLV
jgi:uncharacterized protein YycO